MGDLFSIGTSGLLAFQRSLNTISHNIANVNTIGYKTQRALFADLAYETLRAASSSNVPQKGGTNPSQIGLGVKLAATDRKFTQGSMEATGDQLDIQAELDLISPWSWHFDDDFMNFALVDRLRQQGIPSFVFTVNSSERALELRQYGVTGIFTDYPSKMTEIV